MAFVVGIDTGGTFTDTVVIDDAGVSIGKISSTSPEFVEGVINSRSDAARAAGRPGALQGRGPMPEPPAAELPLRRVGDKSLAAR